MLKEWSETITTMLVERFINKANTTLPEPTKNESMKLGKLLIGTILTLVAVAYQAGAQDIHFSQFYVSNLTLNPATTGVMPCKMRVSAIYRNQWISAVGAGAAFNTFGLGVEGKFAVGNYDYAGAGLSVWADRAGASEFTSIQASLSGSYLKKIGGRRANEHYLVAGGQIGFIQRSIKTQALRWGAQWDGSAFSSSLGSSEDIGPGANTRPKFDMSAGLMWFSSLDKDNKSNFYAGIGFQHLTKVDVSLLPITTNNISSGDNPFEQLYTRFSIHAGGEARLARRLALVPNAAVMLQGPSAQMNVGTGVKFDFSKRAYSNQAFTVGAYVRGSNSVIGDKEQAGFAVDAIIALVRLRFNSSAIGFSYDINVSSLSAATGGNGAFELSYVWTMCTERGRRLGCPTF